MRKFFVTLMASLLSCSAAFAFWPEAADSSFEIGLGYRSDKIRWELDNEFILTTPFAGIPADTGVRARSELEWKNLRIWQIDLKGKYVTCDHIYLRGYADYGWITHGKVRDSDFIDTASDESFSFGEEVEFSLFHGKSDKGHVYDASIGVGYQFELCDDSIALTPIIGYSWHGQHLKIKDDHHSSSSSSIFPDFSSISNLNSKYNTRWNGPWLGLDFDYRFCCNWSLYAAYEYHWATYNARGDWNLRTDLINGFHHHSKRAYGQVFDIGIKWDFCECWTVALSGKWQWWKARKGTDRALIADISDLDLEVKCFLYADLKDVKWNSGCISIDVGMIF